jgi:hypothetical protein
LGKIYLEDIYTLFLMLEKKLNDEDENLEIKMINNFNTESKSG